ncbi:MAG: RsmB/NOP family class I SAM-dependent RNA methyltransferase [Rhodospirillales bacterium]|nr:RsmB/NOP family class I SAM-dependent RNA methyltransferase [Rhodospirillales bacterium]
MLPAARTEAAIYLLGKIAQERRAADDIVRAWFQARRFVGSKDRRDIRERVYGVLRRINRLDWHLGFEGPQQPTVRERVLADLMLEGEDGPALFDGSPHGPKPLNEAEQAIAERLKGKTLNDPTMPAFAQAEIPKWLAAKLEPLFGTAFLREMAALNEPAPMDLRVALARVTRAQAQQALNKSGVKAKYTPLSPLGLRIDAHTDIARTPAFKKGLVEVQDEGSQLLSLLVGAKPSMAVVDYCAGAGGKTLAIADRMGLQGGHSAGRLVACDIDEARLTRMDRRLHRARLNDLVERHVLGSDDIWAETNAGQFDRVLVDAPCTGSGTWRRHPEQKKRLTEDRLAELMAAQTQVLNGAAALVKAGGRLIYATCSLLREENEDRLDAFLKTHPQFKVIPMPTVWAETFGGEPSPVDGDYLRLTPAQHGTDGFFVGVLERHT